MTPADGAERAGAARGRLRLLPGAAVARLDAVDPEQVIRELAGRLLSGGHVTAAFADAAVQRERTHPTGLPTVIPTAIPHTDPEHVITPGLAVATLVGTVEFGEMGSGGAVVPVRFVVMLALKEANAQLAALQQLVARLQDQDGVRTVLEAADDGDLVRRVEAWISG